MLKTTVKEKVSVGPGNVSVIVSQGANLKLKMTPNLDSATYRVLVSRHKRCKRAI